MWFFVFDDRAVHIVYTFSLITTCTCNFCVSILHVFTYYIIFIYTIFKTCVLVYVICGFYVEELHFIYTQIVSCYYILLSFVVLPSQNISWCKIECVADSLTSVGMAPEQTPPPPLTILSLSMKTVLNTRTKTNEVLT